MAAAGTKADPGQKAIFVAVRTRPLSLTERINENAQAVFPTTSDRVIKIQDGTGKDNDYTLDHCFWESDTNEHVYNTLGKQTLDNAFNGFNGTIFAYGQTGSGKTHTMMGGEGEAAGIIPRLCHDMFRRIDESGVKAEVHVSYVEIYGKSEKLADLLLPEGKTNDAMCIRQRGPEEYFVQGLTAYQPTTATQMEMFIRAGSDRRAVASTDMNDTSSRSHAVFIVELSQHIGGSRRTSRIKLVDLAGSENIEKSGATGQRQVEAVSINKALSTLRRVLDACAQSSKGTRTHIPFRDSALTKLLADSIGGNSRTTMIAAVGPSMYNYAESKNTLQWACKARKIKCKAVKNERNDKAKLTSLKDEVESLRAKLAALEAGAKKGGADPKELEALRDQLGRKEKELRDELAAAKLREAELERIQAETRGRLDELKKDYEESQHDLGNARLAWKALVRNLKHEEGQNREMKAELAGLHAKLERFAAIDDVEKREAVVLRKEKTCGSIDDHEAALVAIRAELEPKLAATKQLEEELAAREAELARREAAVAEREAFLLKRDSFYAQSGTGGNGGRAPLRSTPNTNFRGGARVGGVGAHGVAGASGSFGISGNMVISAHGARSTGPSSRGSSASSDGASSSSGGYVASGNAHAQRRASSFKPRGLQRPVMVGRSR